MKLETQLVPSPENLPAPPSPSRRRAFRLFLVVTALFLCVLTLVFVFFNSSQPPVTFLTPEQFNHTLKPGPFTRWKNKLISLANPLLRHFQSHHPDVIITSTIVGRDAGFAPPDQLGAPVVTNSTGLQAWILTPGESHTVLSELRTKGYPSSRLIAYVPAAGSRRVSLTTSRSTALGDSIDLTATATDVSVNLVFKESSTAPAMRDLDQLVIKTNFNVACRALIPASGGLLINCRNADPANHINYWLLLTPQLLDASGKPIRRPL